ncbi:MAG: sulfurtransferase TusA family protein [Clostridiales bacterium]|nr:sulfurtransferase TusA family protein [Clostridiales bacterium]
MNEIDCFGDICPIPILKMQHELEILKPGESFEMVVDHSCVIESIQDSLKKTNIKYEIEEVMNGVWEIIITKPL